MHFILFGNEGPFHLGDLGFQARYSLGCSAFGVEVCVLWVGPVRRLLGQRRESS